MEEAKPAAPPPAQPFAVMRMTHEAIRVGLKEVETAAKQLTMDPKTQQRLAGVLSSLVDDCLKLHMRQENEKFFPLLDSKCDGAATKAGFVAEHDADVEAVDELLGCIEALSSQKKDASLCSCFAAPPPVDETPFGITKAAVAWVEKHEKHLKHEEEVMVPLTQKVGDTPQARAHLAAEVLFVDEPTFAKSQLPYVVTKLKDKFGPLSTYLLALQAISTPEAYARYIKVVEDVKMLDAMWAQLEAAGITGAGKLQPLQPPVELEGTPAMEATPAAVMEATPAAAVEATPAAAVEATPAAAVEAAAPAPAPEAAAAPAPEEAAAPAPKEAAAA